MDNHGSRGSFININFNDFRFTENGQIYHTIGFLDNIRYLIQDDHKGGKKIPDYAHSPNFTIYALVVKEKVKSIGIYDNHIKIRTIDLGHTHRIKGSKEILHNHYHLNLYHGDGYPLTNEDIELINKIEKGLKKIL